MPETLTIVVPLLTSGSVNTNISLPANQETAVVNTQIFAPGQGPGKFDPQASLRPVKYVQGEQLPYKWWEVDLRLSPLTVQNLTAQSGTLVVNIYSDNAYVYQQMATIGPNAYFPLFFGAQSLGFIISDPAMPGMPVVVTMRPTVNMLCLRNTNQPATFRAPNPPNYPSVFGLAAQLIPLD